MRTRSVWGDLADRLGNRGAVDNARRAVEEHELLVLRIEALARKLGELHPPEAAGASDTTRTA